MRIDCGDRLFVGDARSCDEAAWGGVIHITRRSDLRVAACRTSVMGGGGPDDLVLSWREEEGPGPVMDRLAELVAFGRRPGSLLVHCLSGHCRSMNLAVLVARLRGMDPFAVMDRLNRERFRQAGGVPAWKWADLNTFLTCELPA